MKQVKACVLVLFLAALLVACAPLVTTVIVTVAPQVTPRMVTATPAPTIALTSTSTPNPRIKRHEGVNVLLLLPDHYGANYYLNKDNFELFGWDVTVAGVEKTIGPCTSFAAQHGCRAVAVDVLISDVADITAYDVLAIMPSTRFTSGRGSEEPYGDLLESQEALDLIASAVEEGLVVYAPCAGVRVLAAADVINGKNVTGRSQFKDEYSAAGATHIGGSPPPVIDDNIVTAMRGLYYHVQNCQAVATSLESVPTEYVVEKKEEVTLSDAIAQDGAAWTRTFGGSNSEGGRAIAETSDGGFIIAGYTYSFGAGNADVYLIKTGSDGNVIWSKAFGGPGWEYGFSVSQTDDGGYIVTGYTSSDGAGSKDVYLIKTDSAGNEVWTKTYGGPGLDVGRSVLETSDGGYVVIGYTESFGAGESDAYLISTDSAGNEVWTKTFGGSGPEMGGSVDETSDGGYVIVGASGSYSDNSDVYLVKTNPEGNEVWSTTVSHPSAHLNYDWGNSVRETNDGGYIIVGNSDLERDLMDVYLIKTDSEGNAVWAQAFGERFYDYGSSVRETSEGGYIVSGATKSAVTGQNDVYVRKVDSEGREVWTRTFGSDNGSEWGSAVCETGDGDYVIVGHTDSYGAGSYDVWLIRVGREEIETG
jgi:putative intracellular protease/amidase